MRPFQTTPLMSVTHMFSRGRPSFSSTPRHDSAAAPAPDTTSFTFAMSLPTSDRPLSIAAPTMIAVPCWSSWNTGIDMRSRSFCST